MICSGVLKAGFSVSVLTDLDQSLGALHADLVQEVGLVQEDVGEGQRDPHLPGLLQQVGRVRDPVAGEDHFGAGGLDLLQIGSEVGQEELVVILADDLRVRVVLLQPLLEASASTWPNE